VPATNAVQMRAVKRSVIERRTSTAGATSARSGIDRMIPPLRSLLSPTAVPIAEVVRFKASIPAMRTGRNCHVGHGDTGAEDVDEERREEYRLDGDVRECSGSRAMCTRLR